MAPQLSRTILTATFALAAMAPCAWPASPQPEALYSGTGMAEVLALLHEECYSAGMAVETLREEIIVCNAALQSDTRVEGAAMISVHGGHLRHRIRFTLAARGSGVRVWASPWIEVEEPEGRLLVEEIRSDEYLRRVQDVLDRLGERLGQETEAREPWRGRYDSAEAWRLDAHLHAVAHCDRTLDDLTPELLERQLAAAGVQPRTTALRDRCEELHEVVYRWALARGMAQPDVDAYAAYRAALPPEERVCGGRLALMAVCR